MITMEELAGDNFSKNSSTVVLNLVETHAKINYIRKIWNRPMIVTSGLRTLFHHLRIYRQKGIPKSKIPMGSCHLIGAAIDIEDVKGELMAWLKANPEILKDAGLWCEEGTKGWVHFQIFPPRSGKRWFLP